MAIKNRVKEFVDRMGITRYQFYKETGISPGTAYNLYDNPDWIPQVNVLDKICERYKVQPGDLIYWVPSSSLEKSV